VAASEETDEEPVDHVLLSNDTECDLAAHVLDEAGVGGRGSLSGHEVL
jgi:hypothetical protein